MKRAAALDRRPERGSGRQGARGVALRLAATETLLGFVWIAGRQALGNYLALAPRAYLARAQEPSAHPARADLEQAIAELRRAGAVDPRNPQVPAGIGQATLLLALQSDGAQRLRLLDAALGDYHSALALRPNSPYLWAALMSTLGARAAVQPLGAAELAEFSLAMSRAVRLGPWEPDVLQQVIEIGPRSYAGLTPDARRALEVAAQHTVALQLRGD